MRGRVACKLTKVQEFFHPFGILEKEGYTEPGTTVRISEMSRCSYRVWDSDFGVAVLGFGFEVLGSWNWRIRGFLASAHMTRTQDNK